MKNTSRILVVDDDPAIRSLLTFRLEGEGFQVDSEETGEAVQEKLSGDFPYSLVLLDMMLPGIQGGDLLQEIKKEYADCQVVTMTAYPSLKMGVAAIKEGAFDFITKPFDIAQLIQIVKNAEENLKLRLENQVLRQTLQRPAGFSDLIGHSPKMEEVRELIRQAAPSLATVLITGESGTGKEVAAQTIHKNSLLHQGPFIVVNCGAIPETLIESELFGYEKGAFTGAAKQTKGKFEMAHNGTIFLDEIGELPLEAQVKLLRVLQEKEVVRLGGGERIKVNFRVVVATNRDLAQRVREGVFREDLYYRIALFLISMPGVRERGSDVLLLANHFLEKFAEIEARPVSKLAKPAEVFLKKHNWPGNVRQLENCMHRTILMNPGKETIAEDDLRLLPSLSAAATGEDASIFDGEIQSMRHVEARAIEEALRITRGNIKEASFRLEISRVTLYRKMKEYKIKRFLTLE